MIRVKTAEFKNHLSRYLGILRTTGETITVYDRNTPVAKVTPIEKQSGKPPSIWELRKSDEKLHGPWIEDFDLPERKAKESIKLDSPLEE